MESIDRALSSVIENLSDENYSESFAFYRFWFDIGLRYHNIPPDQVFDAIWKNRGVHSMDPRHNKLFLSTAHLTLRFARDVQSDRILAPHTPWLQGRLSAKSLQDFFSNNLEVVYEKEHYYGSNAEAEFYADTNLIAHWANLGYAEEAAIHNDILQSLISHLKLYDHQADALLILFKLAGATFEAYADTSLVDRCFELLKGHNYVPPFPGNYPAYREYLRVRRELVQVSARSAL